jgi:hypothetical protein
MCSQDKVNLVQLISLAAPAWMHLQRVYFFDSALGGWSAVCGFGSVSVAMALCLDIAARRARPTSRKP